VRTEVTIPDHFKRAMFRDELIDDVMECGVQAIFAGLLGHRAAPAGSTSSPCRIRRPGRRVWPASQSWEAEPNGLQTGGRCCCKRPRRRGALRAEAS